MSADDRRLDVQCVAFTPRLKNTLRGFCDIRIPALHLVIRDIAIHEKNGSRWAQLPAKPVLKDGQAVVDAATGRIKYVSMIGFDHPGTRSAFSQRVVEAVLEHAGEEALDGVVP